LYRWPGGNGIAVGEPGLQRRGSRRIEGDDSFLAPLAEHADDATRQVHVIQVQPHEFTQAQP
jgi:hypothetical protein